MSVAPKIEETKPIINQSYCEEHGLLKEKLFTNHLDILGVMMLG